MNAQDLVYKPKNPAFGGDTFNYQWLLSSAESQNKLKDEEKYFIWSFSLCCLKVIVPPFRF